ncbi:MAG TPA: secretin N-terminal domain-containing protein, partial [Candidatus Omnitrophota bacterium]|nr:secretin N-terminal domain-containing protein [Candidatus Omnitrophota bacterium]
MNHKISRIFMIFVLALSFSGFPGYCADGANVQDADWVSLPSGASSSASPSAAIQKTEEKVAEPGASTASEDADVTPTTSPGNVTVNFKGADIKTVLAYISEVAGVDIVPSPDVKGLVDLKLTNKPWKVALDIIVRNYGYAYEREGDIIRVVTIDRLKQEELITQTFVLNYAKAKNVVDSIKGMVTDPNKLKYDERTNTVVVTDIPTKIYKIGEIIQSLDKMTEQVLIETIAIETALGDDERMGIDWTAKITATGAKRPTTFPFDYYTSDNKGLDKFLPLVQTGVTQTQLDPASGLPFSIPPSQFPTGSSGPAGVDPNDKAFPFVDLTVDSMRNAFTFGTLDFSEFKAVLEMIKQRADSDVVANPRIMTLNNEPALIHVGESVYMPDFERNSTTGKMEIKGYSSLRGAGSAGSDVGIQSGVNLLVTPHINNRGEIIVDLVPSISDDIVFRPIDPQGNIYAPSIRERTAKTQARINDGETIFIGGLIREENIVIDNKLPIIGDMLGNVPGVGYLVSHKSTRKVKRELIFFVTVNIIKSGKKLPNSPVIEKAQNPK